MSYMKDADLTIWEKSVEFRFSQWLVVSSIENNFRRKFDENLPSKTHRTEDILYDFNDCLGSLDSYIPLDGNLEKLIGDGFSVKNSQFTLIEMKAELDESTISREWDCKTANEKDNKGKCLLFDVIKNKMIGEELAIKLSEEFHLILGFSTFKNGNEESKELSFAPYWNFINKETKFAGKISSLNEIREKWTTFENFTAYIELFISEAFESQKLSIQKEHESLAIELSSLPTEAIAEREKLKNRKYLLNWHLKNTNSILEGIVNRHVHLAINHKGRVHVIKTTWGRMQFDLEYANKNQLDAVAPKKP